MTGAETDEQQCTTARRDLVEKQIFESAIRLFAERGFAGTNLQDIARAAGLTRPALYYYVNSKNDLLAKLVRQVTFDIADALEAVGSDTARTPVERLRQMVANSALRQAQDPARFRLMLRSEAELPSDIAEEYDQGRRRVLHAFVAVIEEGIKTGELRPLDARIAALGVIGMVNWIAWWHHPGDPRSEADIASEIADLAVAGLQDPRTVASSTGGTQQALRLLEEDVSRLKAMLDD
ncbi:TetR/AcrR family transcriptional regulator [Mycolicibacterium sp. HS_4_1]